MQRHNIQSNTPRKRSISVGRGGKRGKTSGRGTKGQKARAGHKIRPEMRDVIKKLPKLRGRGVNTLKSIKVSNQVVNVEDIELNFEEGAIITPSALHKKDLVRQVGGKIPSVKILNTGELTKKFTFDKCLVSKTAALKIQSVGGTIKA